MHNPESAQENNVRKILWDFEIQIDHLISARQPKLVIVNKRKRTCRIVDKTMKTWRVELTVGGRRLAEAKIKKVFSKEMLYHPYYS